MEKVVRESRPCRPTYTFLWASFRMTPAPWVSTGPPTLFYSQSDSLCTFSYRVCPEQICILIFSIVIHHLVGKDMGDWVPRVLCVSHEVGLQVRLRVGLIEMGWGGGQEVPPTLSHDRAFSLCREPQFFHFLPPQLTCTQILQALHLPPPSCICGRPEPGFGTEWNCFSCGHLPEAPGRFSGTAQGKEPREAVRPPPSCTASVEGSWHPDYISGCLCSPKLFLILHCVFPSITEHCKVTAGDSFFIGKDEE